MHNPCKLMIMMYLLLVSSCMPDAHMTLGDIAQRMYTQRMYTQRMYAYAHVFLLSCVRAKGRRPQQSNMHSCYKLKLQHMRLHIMKTGFTI